MTEHNNDQKEIDIRDYAGEIVQAMQPWRQRSVPRQHIAHLTRN